VKCGKKAMCVLIVLGVAHFAVLMAGFISPYDASHQNRELPFAPPTRIHFVDSHGRIHFQPFVCALEERSGSEFEYSENLRQCSAIHSFVRGADYQLFGWLHSNVHLFGADAPIKISLMGTDAFGRDIFSRFLYGGQVSLFAGLFATMLTLATGTALGTLAGYFGGWSDALIMRSSELFLALPWLYLLFAVRAFLPLSLGPRSAFLLIIAVIGLVGWARPAKMIRGVVLSTREKHYVLAARLFGGSNAYVLRRHVLPDTYSIILTQAALLIPQYILAEVVLSFLGLGVSEPAASWGNMLSALQQYAVLVSYWWMLLPGLALIPICAGYLFLAADLQRGRVAGRI
jgi:peptide/nickel transport system permease protein